MGVYTFVLWQQDAGNSSTGLSVAGVRQAGGSAFRWGDFYMIWLPQTIVYLQLSGNN
ncbi:MAG: hypothetical protein HYY40_14435 [Bacteroidetes bacterium]|nr:hypothetical protein [Bacteroidota bacterium]